MEEALQVLNEMKRAGVIQEYAIGGGMALVFYTEPVLTYDLDVFVLLQAGDASAISMTPIYSYLAAKGHAPEGEHVVIGDMPVQLLPAYNALVDEAVQQARAIRFGETDTRVVRAEHLAAIMVQTYRPKDRERLALLLAEAEMDTGFLQGVLTRYGLVSRWEDYQRRSHDG
ncbi:MAG: hypothetical protein HY321_19145 [Armatimonadetes bacterium]|nr:hypothetical protein [Armatimonadota bacterium]